MDNQRGRALTRANVLLIGFIVFVLGGISFFGFKLIGLDGASAGIAAEAFLIFILLVWTSSYLFRVLTGKMTFMEQRKRYLSRYENITTQELQSKFDSLSEEEQRRLLENIAMEDQGSK
tara:strand:+ start:138 stop:494 length:357 start_codon:yes stop_codon:yes gene_type:complete